jgi:hypothetical protein
MEHYLQKGCLNQLITELEFAERNYPPPPHPTRPSPPTQPRKTPASHSTSQHFRISCYHIREFSTVIMPHATIADHKVSY